MRSGVARHANPIPLAAGLLVFPATIGSADDDPTVEKIAGAQGWQILDNDNKKMGTGHLPDRSP